jgi:hypothetical protein
VGRRRRGAALVAVAAVIAAISGCAPVATLMHYNPSDGIRVDLGEGVIINNLMVLTEEEGSPGLVLGGITNSGGTATRVTLQTEDAQTTVAVGANQTVLLQPPADVADDAAAGDSLDVVLDTVAAPPGGTLPMLVSTPQAGSAQVSVPVLDGTIPPYEQYLPVEPSPTSTATTSG